MYSTKNLYIFFIRLALIIFFFSTSVVSAKAFQIDNIEITEPFEKNFSKNKVIDIGFRKAFFKLVNLIVKSDDLKKIDKIKLKEIKSMVESFSIKEEKFINQTYFVNIGVLFDKKKIFTFLESKNIFPAQIVKETFLFIPIIIDQNNDELVIFSNNEIFNNWNKYNKKTYQITYLLPTEDLEDMNLIKSKSNTIENYDFNEILRKYVLNNSIVSLIFKNSSEVKVLSKIKIGDKLVIKNDSFENLDLLNEEKIEYLIFELKEIYEDQWKEFNQINTSIKLPLFIKIDSKKFNTSLEFENILKKIDLINEFSIKKINKDFIYYEVIFNGTTKNFINIMSQKNYKFDTQKKIWILK